MLKAAQLYEKELNIAMLNKWYTQDMDYYMGWCGGSSVKLPDSNEYYHHFVSVNNDDKVIGYLCYEINWVTKSATNFGMIYLGEERSKDHAVFLDDIRSGLADIFDKYHLNRMVWRCVADNPVRETYEAFCFRHGGHVSGYNRECAMLKDGRLHDSIEFEILRSDIEKIKIEQNTKESGI